MSTVGTVLSLPYCSYGAIVVAVTIVKRMLTFALLPVNAIKGDIC